MKNRTLSKLMFTFCFISLVIAIYQIYDTRLFYGILSLIYSSVFLIGGLVNRKKQNE